MADEIEVVLECELDGTMYRESEKKGELQVVLQLMVNLLHSVTSSGKNVGIIE